MTSRRGFLTSCLLLAAAPAIVKADTLMRVVVRKEFSRIYPIIAPVTDEFNRIHRLPTFDNMVHPPGVVFVELPQGSHYAYGTPDLKALDMVREFRKVDKPRFKSEINLQTYWDYRTGKNLTEDKILWPVTEVDIGVLAANPDCRVINGVMV